MARSKAATPASADPPPPFDFEQAMTELETVVASLEQGEVPLEEALRAYERGVELTRACQQALTQAEQKVELLATRSDGSSTLMPFDPPTDEADS